MRDSWGDRCSRSSIDLHNLGPNLGSSVNLTSGGVTLEVQGFPTLTSTATNFGIDSAGPNDDPNLLDGGSGSAESLSLLFGSDVIIDGVTVSQFDAADAGTLNVKGRGNVPLHSGATDVGLPADASSANIISYTGPLVAGPSNGFSVDSVTVHTAPEPSVAALAALGIAAAALARLRRNAQRMP